MRNRQCLCGFAQFPYIALVAQGASECPYLGPAAHKPPISFLRRSTSLHTYRNSFPENAKECVLVQSMDKSFHSFRGDAILRRSCSGVR